MSATRLRVAGIVELLVGLGLAAFAVWSLDALRWPFRLLAVAGILVAFNLALTDLRRADDLRYGTFSLLVVCDHQPDGRRFEGLTRHELWLQLATLDPAHHLVWIDDVPLFGDWRKRGRT